MLKKSLAIAASDQFKPEYTLDPKMLETVLTVAK